MKRNWYALAGGVLLAACVLAFSGCGGDGDSGPRKASGDNGVAKSLKITGFADADINKPITVSLMVGMSPESGGAGTIGSDKTAVIAMKFPNKSQKDQNWTGTGTFLAWMVTGNIAAAKTNNNSTDGMTGKQATVNITSAETEVDFSTTDDMAKTMLQMFIANYSPDGYGE
ncbi:MAG: hypothetical protein MdMp014T_0727 [Treponematales bacterium]